MRSRAEGSSKKKAAWVGSHGLCLSSSAHGSSTRGVSVRCATSIFRTRGMLLNTDRAERVLHGSRLALHGACQAVLRLSTGRVSSVPTGCANQHGSLVLHGSRLLQHGSSLFLHRSCNFLSSEVRTLNFLSIQGLL